MLQARNIAPRVIVYPVGTAPLVVEEGWIALAQLPIAPLELAPRLLPDSLPAPDTAIRVAAPRHVVFGDGSHPTTRLCATAVDLLCRQRPGLAVLDVGTGSGILTRIARARGASFVVGTDIDSVALDCARAHAGLDVIGTPDIPSAGGNLVPSTRLSTDVRQANIHFGGEPPDYWGARFGLAVANILESPLHALAPALRRALVPGGTLLISGFTRPQIPSLRVRYEQQGLTFQGDFRLGEWALLKFVLTGRQLV